jgi:hypothetical protein
MELVWPYFYIVVVIWHLLTRNSQKNHRSVAIMPSYCHVIIVRERHRSHDQNQIRHWCRPWQRSEVCHVWPPSVRWFWLWQRSKFAVFHWNRILPIFNIALLYKTRMWWNSTGNCLVTKFYTLRQFNIELASVSFFSLSVVVFNPG